MDPEVGGVPVDGNKDAGETFGSRSDDVSLFKDSDLLQDESWDGALSHNVIAALKPTYDGSSQYTRSSKKYNEMTYCSICVEDFVDSESTPSLLCGHFSILSAATLGFLLFREHVHYGELLPKDSCTSPTSYVKAKPWLGRKNMLALSSSASNADPIIVAASPGQIQRVIMMAESV